MKKVMIEASVPDGFNQDAIQTLLEPVGVEVSLITPVSEVPESYGGQMFVVVNLSRKVSWIEDEGAFHVLPAEDPHTYGNAEDAVKYGLYGAWEEDRRHEPGETLGVFALAPIDHDAIMKWFTDEVAVNWAEPNDLEAYKKERGW